MRFVLAGLTLACLVIAFTTDSPGLLGLSLFGAFLCSLGAVFTFAQARIESSQQREVYIPSPEERELMRKAMEKRKLDAAAKRTVDNDDEREQA
jgi:hypothetical protein